MAPIKYEEDIKNRLDKRTIKPSVKSWDTLSQRLDSEEKKNNKKGFWWLGIAASVIGVLLVSNFFLNIETTNNINTVVVEDNTTKTILKIEVPKQIIETPKQETIVDIEENTINKTEIELVKKTPKTSNHLTSNTPKTSNTKEKTRANKIQIKKALITETKTSEEQIIVESSININNTTNPRNSNTTDNEINTLLANATKDIAMQKFKKATVPIDYNGLLLAVEDDLDETFRDKMFKAVKKGYETVRESVAERNE